MTTTAARPQARELQPRTRELQKLDAAHHLHPFTHFKALADEGSRIIERGEGVYLWDTEGHRILDGMAGLWCVNVGYARKELADAAHEQMMKLAFYNSFFKCTTPPPVELAKKLVDMTPDGLNFVYYANSGSEANDTIVRMVRHYWNLVGKPTKKTFIGREYGYHGSTMAAASLCGMVHMHEQSDLPLPGFTHVMPPYWYAYGGDMSEDEFGLFAARKLEERILELGPDNVAAFIGEPIQGSGGVIIPPKTYWPEIQRICRQYDVLLIADEVICGFGRLGEWFGSDAYDIKPDFMTLAKGITSGYVPLSAVMVGERVGRTLYEHDDDFNHGFTYSGHPTAAAVALKNIELIENEKLVDNARDLGAYALRRLQEELADNPIVGQVRGHGFVFAIELVEDKASRKFFEKQGKVGLICRDHCFREGLVMRAVRDTMVLSPPLVLSREQADEMVALARRAIDLTAKDIGRL